MLSLFRDSVQTTVNSNLRRYFLPAIPSSSVRIRIRDPVPFYPGDPVPF